uniref:Uncharacterized protein n=1 Tax=Fagus sylvatica TaxID=28930 RepID=A0A2N9IZY4_FAGSY
MLEAFPISQFRFVGGFGHNLGYGSWVSVTVNCRWFEAHRKWAAVDYVYSSSLSIAVVAPIVCNCRDLIVLKPLPPISPVRPRAAIAITRPS